MASSSVKCIIEFIDCSREFDCISCRISEEYWKTFSSDTKYKKPSEWEKETENN